MHYKEETPLKDFNFNPRIKTADDKKRQRNRFLLAGVLVLAGTSLAVRYVQVPQPDQPAALSNIQPLALPSPKTALALPVQSPRPTPEPVIASTDTAVVIPEPEVQTETINQEAGTPPVVSPTSQVSEHIIRSGESLSAIFSARNLSPALLHKIIKSSKAAGELARIRPGQTLTFETDNTGKLIELTLQRDRINSLHISATEQGFDAVEATKDIDTKITETTGIIHSSLFLDGQKSGLTDAQIMELAGLFGWDIDFALEIRNGDRFSLIYEEQYLEGEKFGNGPILAAEFISQGKRYRAIRYTDSKDNIGYYDEEGRNKRRTFIRTPLKFARVSSRFTTKRWHPVLKKWRSHKGVDYAASRGTPVKATGNGKISFRGKKGGYGNVVFIQHGGTYKTVYAHLSKFSKNARRGKKVRQGDIIGYVGSSGLATGPHLHYEFRVNGVHRNPLTVKLPKSQPLPKTELTVFKLNSKAVLAQLNRLSSSTMVASAE